MRKNIVAALLVGATATLHAIEIDEFERRDYDLSTSTSSWSRPPSNHHRLFLDVYNVTDFYDFETNDTPGYIDGTWLADTLRPTATLLWDEHFRIQVGVQAQKVYGDRPGFESVDPWVQLLWQPIKPLSIVLGDLSVPHYYHPALFIPLNYIRGSSVETGAQMLLRMENWYDDLYFNYRHQDTAEGPEKFDLGFVHKNSISILRLTYEAHWVHEGGTLHPHPISTMNDVATLAGVGLHIPVVGIWSVGANASRLHSHRRQDSLTPALIQNTNGHGFLYEGYTRIGRLKVSYEYWRGKEYMHEGGDPWFTLPRLHLWTARWDIILSRDFNLLLRYTAGLAGENDQGVSRFVKSAIHLQASWQFSLPIVEWTTPAAVSEGQPLPTRWDEGV